MEGPSKTLVSGPSPLSSVISTRTPSPVCWMLVLELRVAQPPGPTPRMPWRWRASISSRIRSTRERMASNGS